MHSERNNNLNKVILKEFFIWIFGGGGGGWKSSQLKNFITQDCHMQMFKLPYLNLL
jgi:hypothetical protein